MHKQLTGVFRKSSQYKDRGVLAVGLGNQLKSVVGGTNFGTNYSDLA